MRCIEGCRNAYRDTAGDLAGRVQAGQIEPGDRMPTHAESAGIYDVSVSTASRVHVVLVERAVLYGVQSRGMYVAAPETVTT